VGGERGSKAREEKNYSRKQKMEEKEKGVVKKLQLGEI